MHVAKSPVSGYGLFARRDIHKGEVICMYTGDLKEVDNDNDSLYIVKVVWKLQSGEEIEMHLDACALDNTAGRYANDAHKTTYKNNAAYDAVLRYHELIEKYYVRIVSTCFIPKGAEIFVDYGKDYWSCDT